MSHGHNATSHHLGLNVYGDNLHPINWNSARVRHVDKINHGQLNALERLSAVRRGITPANIARDAPIRHIHKPVAQQGQDHERWREFHRKYMISHVWNKRNPLVDYTTRTPTTVHYRD